jgi:hypothetical protein
VVASVVALLACVTSPDPSRPPFEHVETTDDSEPPVPLDLDGDGWTEAAGDCDDTDAASYPGAYDRPDDGVDGDCDGMDRTCDCLVLEGGASVVGTCSAFGVAARRTLDLAYVLETGMSATSTIRAAGDSLPDVLAALDEDFASQTIGVATFDDYAYSSYGTAPDKPYQLQQQQTDARESVQYVLDGLSAHKGEDSTQSGMEALYQALTGVGYDQDCDADYDTLADVLPFESNPADLFGGTAGQAYDVTDDSTGALGGMGFRADAALRVVVYSTDGWLRDSENGYGTPGGCADDAGFSAVVKAALDANVWLVGVGTSALPVPQMEDLADATGAFADLDSDGSADERLVYEILPGTDTFRDSVLSALDGIRHQVGLPDVYASVRLEVRDDPLGIVSSMGPSEFVDVAWADVDALEFHVAYDTHAYGAEPVVGSVTLAVVGDGFELATFVLDVEIAPL